MNFFKIKISDCDNATTSTNYDSTSESIKEFNTSINSVEESNKENCTTIGKWNRNAILSLIELFKENYNNFKSTSIKNEQVWNEITKKMNERGFKYTKAQIENKFKYLKQRYIKKKDNMGNKSTYESPIVFDYFLEFDEIFGSKPSVKPLAIASSSKLQVNVHDDSTDDEPEIKKIKISKSEKNRRMERIFYKKR